ncbi:10459_t:CDS:2 [Diversispora eburnea]|uniref:10459_t:CDS:1 n=1 Tax=Diversispora eburnea TaxID=1213867 RepID=A0A9N9BYV6_9GLOM|nr:10459_t:CDS:2 [Diversispora eburnea]
MSNETISLETAVETAALTLLDFVIPPDPLIPSIPSIYESLQKNVEPKVIELGQSLSQAVPLLSEGFLAHWLPILNQVEVQLKETERTNVRLENQDNYEYIALSVGVFIITFNAYIYLNVSNLSSLFKLKFSKIPLYQSKLQNIRNTMLLLLSRSKNLKQRVDQLKLLKENQLAQIAQIQQRERTFDQTVLAARIVEITPVENQSAVNTKTAIKKKKKNKTKDKGKNKEKVVIRREIEFVSSSKNSEVTKDI